MTGRRTNRDLRHTVTLQRSPDSVGAQGGANPADSGTPTTYAANVQYGDSTVQDEMVAGATVPRVVQSATVWLAVDPGVTRGDRFLFDGATLNVTGPANDTGYGTRFWVNCEVIS